MNRSTKFVVGAAALWGGRAIVRRFQSRFSFKGRSVIITGGSRGLGLILARELAAEGARLTLLGRDAESLDEAVAELTMLYDAEALAVPCDIGDPEQAQMAIARAINHYGYIDVLINNAGIIQLGPVDHLTVEDFEEAMAVHFWGPLYMTMAALPHMRRQSNGRIVNISSIGGVVAVPHLLPYVASKFALTGLSDGLQVELAKDNIAVTTVIPGLMRTGSHVNALFKGRHEAEFTWFSILGALPVSSINARSAARQIIEACRRGDAHLTITPQARLLALSHALFPGLFANAMTLFNQLLPKPADETGDVIRAGWESSSDWAPSLLTRPSDRVIPTHNQLDEETMEQYHMV